MSTHGWPDVLLGVVNAVQLVLIGWIANRDKQRDRALGPEVPEPRKP